MLKLFTYFLTFRIGYCLICFAILKFHIPNNQSRNVIHSEKIMNIVSRLAGFEKESAKARAGPFLFIVLRYKEHPMNETRINHETIHHMQMSESFGLRTVLSFFENIYARYILKKSVMESYLNKATEQEAYLNQTNKDYISNRPLRATRKYFFHKTLFVLENYQVVLR